MERQFGRAASGRQKSGLSLFPASSEISLRKRTCEALNGCRFPARRLIGLERVPDTSLDTKGGLGTARGGAEASLSTLPKTISCNFTPLNMALHSHSTANCST